MPVISDKDTLLIRCDCHYHVLEVSNDALGLLEEGLDPYFEVSVWNQSPSPITFKDRLKLIWDLVRGKNLAGGDVMITQDDAVKLIQFLSKKVVENQNRRTKKNSHAANEPTPTTPVSLVFKFDPTKQRKP